MGLVFRSDGLVYELRDFILVIQEGGGDEGVMERKCLTLSGVLGWLR